MIKKIIYISFMAWMIATSVIAEFKPVFSDGTNIYTTAGAIGTDTNKLVDTSDQPLSFPFIATNATYETTWAGPWPYNMTLSRVWGQCDSGTGTAWVVESASNATWRIYSQTNAQLTLGNLGGGCAIDFATIEAGNKMGLRYIGGTCTQGLVTVWWHR